MTEFFDSHGVQRDLHWFSTTYGAQIAVADAAFKFALARIDCLKTAGVMTVRVIDQHGVPMEHQQVAISWPDPLLGKFAPAYKRAWLERGKMQYTGGDGYTGFKIGNAADAMTKPPSGGPYSFWALSLSADSDGLLGAGIAADGTAPFALTFALVGDEPVSEPPPVEPPVEPPPVVPPVVPPVEPPTGPGAHMESIQGLHLYMIHDPDRQIQRVWNLRRADGKPRIHKIMSVSAEKCEWLNRMPPDTIWVIRNYDLSEVQFTSIEQAQSLGREHAELHARYCLSAEQLGISRDRLIFEGRNEPQPPEHQYINAYECARIKRAQELNVPHLLVFNFGVGQPLTYTTPQSGVNYDAYEPTRQAARAGDYYGSHLYFGHDGPNACWPDSLDMKWPNEGFRLLQCHWPEKKWIIGEHGDDDGVNQNPKSGWHDLPGTMDEKVVLQLSRIAWAERQYLSDGRIVAVTQFTHDYWNNEWEKFDTATYIYADPFEKYVQGGVNVVLWGDARTDRWRPIIEYRAGMVGLDPRVVAAVGALESNWRVDAISSAGAVGLMQVMPDTAITGRPTKEVLFNPDQNVKWGCNILKGYLDYYNGDLARALAAYNAGPGNIDKWGLDWDAPRVYLGMFVKAWGELWPGVPCPVSVPGGVPVDELRALLLAAGEAHQVIQFNKDAALQIRIFADGFVPNSPEVALAYNGVNYTTQRAERLDTGAVRMYYCVTGDWGTVLYVER